MELEPHDIVERFAIMTVDGGLSDKEAMRVLLKRFPIEGKQVETWDKAISQIKGIAPDALSLFGRARETAMTMCGVLQK